MGIDLGTGEPTRRAAAAGSPSSRADRAWFSPVAWLVAVIPGVLGLVTGGYHVGRPPIWGDEGVTKAMAARSVSQLLATMPHDDIVHGAYYLVVHAVETVAGSSAPTVLRAPSVVAMAVAAAFTALIARRLATIAGSPYPAATGLAAGVLFALLPAVIRYAQEARSYAIVTMLAAITTYLLLKAIEDGGPWWIGYGAAAALTGLFNIFGLLILVAQGVTLLIAAPGLPGVAGRRPAGVLARWVLAGIAAVAVLIPIVAFAYAQRNAISWMTGQVIFRSAAVNLARTWAGPVKLFWPVFGLAAVGVAAEAVTWRRGRPSVTPGSVALPWLVLPPVLLLVASQVHPVYDGRYVEYCLPALAILVAWGLTWLARLVTAAVPSLSRAGLAWPGWLPAAAILILLVIALIPADAKVSLPSSRPDNLAGDSQIVAANAKPGDIVFFIPVSYRPVEVEYPAQWRGVRDIALAQSPVASDTLYGTDVSPAELLKRFTHVTGVWVYTQPAYAAYMDSARATPVDKEEMSLVARMKLVRRWVDGDKMLMLYQTR
ncbi:MAG TPA: glycosyltransferase family 39 protein [Trebonia sp.]|nr:glycosyltransferase family 39 protein [Trebonia sp.]